MSRMNGEIPTGCGPTVLGNSENSPAGLSPGRRILIAMVEPPLPFGNAAARWFYVLLRGLVERGHQVTVFATCSKPAEIAKARELFPSPRYDLRCYPHPERRGWRAKWETLRRPYSYMFGPELRADLRREMTRGFDILHLEQLWAGWLGLQHADRALVNVHHFVWIDLEHTRPPTWRGRLDRVLMLSAERRLLRSLKYFRTSSPRLDAELLAVNPAARVTHVPLGLETGLYEYIPDAQRTTRPVISIIGSMGWYPSHSAAVRLLTRLWPTIRDRIPDACVQIVGWQARWALRDFLTMPGVEVLENVPDMRPYFERTSVLVYAPGRGSGMKVKILEAMAYGVPVVTTAEGVEGLPAVDGLHAGVCEDDEGLIERTVELLRSPESQNRQRAAARQLVERHCDPGRTVDLIEAIYSSMLKDKATPPACGLEKAAG